MNELLLQVEELKNQLQDDNDDDNEAINMHSSESVVPENFNVPPIVDVPSTANICEQSEQIDALSSGNICEDDIENNERDEVPFEWVSGFSKNPRIPGRAIVNGNSI